MADFDSYSFFDGTNQTAVTQYTWADYWRGVIPDGVVAGIGNEMKPYGDSQYNKVFVKSGACFADNHRGVMNGLTSLDVAAPHATKDRIDIVVARVTYGNTNSKMELAVVTGSPSADPSAPNPTQTSETYEVKLAEIYVKCTGLGGDGKVKAEDVTDCRNLFTCGEQTFSFKNTHTQALTEGMIVKLDSEHEGGIVPAGAGDMPIGVVASNSIGVGGTGQINTKPGTVANVLCDNPAVNIGDALVVGSNVGKAIAGGAPYFAAGLALQAKAANVVGNVKSLLTIISKIPFQNAWYLPGGITESDVIAAYQFVNRRSASDALVNINQGEEYVLTLSDENTITWDIETGFKLPASTRLVNDLLISESGLGVLGLIKTAAFGFSVEPSAGSGSVGGIMLAPKKVLMVWRDFDSITDGPAIYRAGNSGQRATSVASCPVNGVLGGNFGSSSVTPEIYLSGTKLATEGHNSAPTITTSAGIGNPSGALSPLNLTCVVLYSKALTAEQHQNLSEKITALGGLS